MNFGETLGLVLLSSDKTHLTVSQGDKQCHAVYLSCGNIRKSIRTKVGAHCWVMLAQIPLIKFQNSKLQGLLANRLLHLCMDKVLQDLKSYASHGQRMLDPNGGVRVVRTVLAAYIADLPEQQVIACVSSSHAPSSLASHAELGNSHGCSLRKGSETLQALQELKGRLGDAGLPEFKKAAKVVGLNGVDKPFWRNWFCADPSLFLTPDALHQWHKFFMDHVVEWVKSWMGNEELDRRLSILQPRIGFRHFHDGITRFKQHSGKETKDVERSFLCVIAGHENLTPGILTALRALLDFIYLAQYDNHSDTTLLYLRQALHRFHSYKSHISKSGVRSGKRKKDGFNIPKLELMQHVERLVKLLGSTPQFSSEQTERCHIEMAKVPYKATNRKHFVEQMCRYLDRRERIFLFSHLLRLHSDENGMTFRRGSNENSGLRKKALMELTEKYMPNPAKDIFQEKTPFCSETTAFHLRKGPNLSNVLLQSIQDQGLPNFMSDVRHYWYGPRANPATHLPFKTVCTWWRVQIQTRVPQDAGVVLMDPVMAEACPPSEIRNKAHPGRYSFVLFKRTAEHDGVGLKGQRPLISLAYPLTKHSS